MEKKEEEEKEKGQCGLSSLILKETWNLILAAIDFLLYKTNLH